MNTIKRCLEETPEPYRTQALRNLNPLNAGLVCYKLSSAVGSAFYWGGTPEGHNYRHSPLSDKEFLAAHKINAQQLEEGYKHYLASRRKFSTTSSPTYSEFGKSYINVPRETIELWK